MKKKLPIFFMFFIWLTQNCLAQDKVYPLNINSRLVYSTAPFHQPTSLSSRNFWAENGNIVITSDTLKLPFLDDFYKDQTRPFHFFDQYIYDSVLYVYGPCDSVFGLSKVLGRFHLNTSWDYSFDVLNQKVDSTPKSPIVLHFFSGTSCTCLENSPTNFVLYPPYYTYTFDSVSGAKKDSTIFNNDADNPDTILEYTPKVYKARIPSSTLWIDNYAYINDHFPILPPSIGVATLDGLNQFGLPYNNASSTTYGIADHLTSKPLDLSGLTDADSVYFSFFYQPQGRGDWPNTRDSLVLEFLNYQTSNWDRVWSTAGLSTAPGAVPDFKQVFIRVPFSNSGNTIITDYLYNSFQFRFLNYASLAGNNDHWHIDYVKLDKLRSVNDTSFSDIAFAYNFPSILKRYEEMPARQFTNAELADSISLYVMNNNQNQADNNPPATNFNLQATEAFPGASAVATDLKVFNSVRVSKIDLVPSSAYTVPTITQDSMVIHSSAFLSVPNVNTQNDSISHDQILGKILAYDDASAEHAYGLENLGIKKMGYEFLLNNPDTLFGFQVHFSNIDVKVSDLVFTFHLWDSLQLNDVNYVDQPFYTSSLLKPYYIDSINGYVTYKLDTPKYIQKSKIYFGWAQDDTRNIQIGYDVNSLKGSDHIYIFTSGTWKKSNVFPKGSPMMRLVFGSNYPATLNKVDEITDNQSVIVYPNPTNSFLNFKFSELGSYQAVITNMVGQQLIQTQLDSAKLDLSNLSDGIYILNIKNKSGIDVYKGRIIKGGN